MCLFDFFLSFFFKRESLELRQSSQCKVKREEIIASKENYFSDSECRENASVFDMNILNLNISRRKFAEMTSDKKRFNFSECSQYHLMYLSA